MSLGSQSVCGDFPGPARPTAEQHSSFCWRGFDSVADDLTCLLLTYSVYPLLAGPFLRALLRLVKQLRIGDCHGSRTNHP